MMFEEDNEEECLVVWSYAIKIIIKNKIPCFYLPQDTASENNLNKSR